MPRDGTATYENDVAAFRLGIPELPQTCQETAGLRYTVLFHGSHHIAAGGRSVTSGRECGGRRAFLTPIAVDFPTSIARSEIERTLPEITV